MSITEEEAAKRLVTLFRELFRDAEAEARELRRLLASVADDACSMGCPSTGKAGVPIPHTERCIAVRAAIEE